MGAGSLYVCVCVLVCVYVRMQRCYVWQVPMCVLHYRGRVGRGGRVCGGGGGWEDWTLTRGAEERQVLPRSCRRSAGDEDSGRGTEGSM